MMTVPTKSTWKEHARQLKREIHALLLTSQDPRVPWYARLFVLCLLGYAFSPIDLIPDFIPVLGYVDDLILLPLGVALALKMIPVVVLQESRERAQELLDGERPRSWAGAFVIVLVWLLCLLLVALLCFRWAF